MGAFSGPQDLARSARMAMYGCRLMHTDLPMQRLELLLLLLYLI